MRTLRIFLFSFYLTFVCLGLNAQTNEMIGQAGPYFGLEPPGDEPEIFAQGIVSTPMYNHCSIAVSQDGNVIYWAMSPLDTPRRIYFSKRMKHGWTKPEIIHFTRRQDGDCPVLSPDGKCMYFNSKRTRYEGDSRRERIWIVKITNGEWGEPEVLVDEINGEHLHWQISVDDQENIYFGSERNGSKGKDDIFMAEKTSDGYKAPFSMAGEINTTDHESTPYVSPDGSYIIFHRNGLKISFKDKEGAWSPAIGMGDYFDGICPYVSPDGNYLFFLKMGMGYNDVYWVSAKVIDGLRQD